MRITMSPTDVVNAGMAECYITVDGKRHLMLMAKEFSATFTKKTASVPILGRRMTGHKSVGGEGRFSMTVYKVSELFDEMCRRYKESGEEVVFDILVTVDDPQSSAGTSSKIFSGCILSGDLTLAALSAENKWLEQKAEGDCDELKTYSKVTAPEGSEWN